MLIDDLNLGELSRQLKRAYEVFDIEKQKENYFQKLLMYEKSKIVILFHKREKNQGKKFFYLL
jgi:hypothetical protein